MLWFRIIFNDSEATFHTKGRIFVFISGKTDMGRQSLLAFPVWIIIDQLMQCELWAISLKVAFKISSSCTYDLFRINQQFLRINITNYFRIRLSTVQDTLISGRMENSPCSHIVMFCEVQLAIMWAFIRSLNQLFLWEDSKDHCIGWCS